MTETTTPGPPIDNPGTSSIHDFDFIVGTWLVRNERLRRRNVGSDDWDSFDGFCVAQLHLGGVVNVDEITFPSQGFSGFTVRTFDVARAEWSIYWVNSTNGLLGTPVVGGFDGDHGLFAGEDVDDGQPIIARFEWFKDDADHAHWQQSFSYDEGATWEVNWKNSFTRSVSR